MRRRRHRWKIGAVLGVLSVALAGALTSVADEPLRRELERRMNDELEGYRVTLGWAGLQPLRLAVEVGDLVIQQVAHPEPAVAHIGRALGLLDGEPEDATRRRTEAELLRRQGRSAIAALGDRLVAGSASV